MTIEPGNEVYISQLELEILGVFIKHKRLHDTTIVVDLEALISKLRGNYATRKKHE